MVDQMHWMHIHAGGQLGCPSASAATVTNGHRFISGPDGDKAYGPPVTSLTTSGDTSAQSHLALTRYPVGSTIRYKRPISGAWLCRQIYKRGGRFRRGARHRLQPQRRLRQLPREGWRVRWRGARGARALWQPGRDEDSSTSQVVPRHRIRGFPDAAFDPAGDRHPMVLSW